MAQFATKQKKNGLHLNLKHGPRKCSAPMKLSNIHFNERKTLF